MFVRTMNIDQPKMINFLKDNFELKEAPCQKSPRGVEVTKKKDIIAKLCPLMLPHRRHFWHELPTNVKSKDLLTNRV